MSISSRLVVEAGDLEARLKAMQGDFDGLKKYYKKALAISAALLNTIHSDPEVEPRFGVNALKETHRSTFSPGNFTITMPQPFLAIGPEPFDYVLFSQGKPSDSGIALELTEKSSSNLLLYTPLGGITFGKNELSIAKYGEGTKAAEIILDF